MIWKNATAFWKKYYIYVLQIYFSGFCSSAKAKQKIISFNIHLKSLDLVVFRNRKYCNPLCWPEISFFRTTPSTWQTVDQNRRSSCRSAPTTGSGGSGRAPRSSTMWFRSLTRETPSPEGSVAEWPGTPPLLLCIPSSLQECFITKGKRVGEMCYIWNSCNIFLRCFICLQTCIENVIIDKESYK